MAIRQVVYSDLSAKAVEDDKHATIIVNDHPALSGGAVRLDAGLDEVAKLTTSKLTFVSLTIHEPNAAPRRVVMDVAEFDKLFKAAPVEEVIARAARADQASEQAPARRGRPKGAGAKPKAEKGTRTDYTDMDNIGLIHRGRVTPREAELVRENLAKAQENRKREGQPPIDPESDIDQKRYFS